MGAASSLLDETTTTYIKGQAESELKAFSPFYRNQYSVTHFSRVEDELEQQKQKATQLLKQRESPEAGEVLYEEAVLHFDEGRKWRERYMVVRANYCLECHDSLESFIKGAPARHILLPTGGTVLTTEERYMAMVDKCFPDSTSSVKEEFAPPLSSMPGQFPVYLRLPYRSDYYFCFRLEARQAGFLSILSACIRHQNQDFLKKKTCEVQAFLKAIQLYRQEKGKYEAWDMMIGSDVRVLANLVMEQLLPTLERDMLPRLKAKKTEKKRMWFATVEASYILVQENLMEGMSSLKKECDATGRQQEVLIHSDMDQIISSRALLEEKLRASVLGPAEGFSAAGVQPYLASVLEELMEPISSGFQEGRGLSEALMDGLCQDLQTDGVTDHLQQKMAQMSRPNLLSCYQRIGSLKEKLPHLQERFGFSNVSSLIHSAQIDLQQLMENAGYTFELMLQKVIQDQPKQAAAAMEKAKHRVLKQYDYDSSTLRKKLFQDALVAITLPHIKKNLEAVCKPELQRLAQSVDVDHAHFVHVENVYESVLLQMLDKEVTKVVKEAASLKKYNLLNDSRDLLSQSSRSNAFGSAPSTPGSPARGGTPITSPGSPAREGTPITTPSTPGSPARGGTPITTPSSPGSPARGGTPITTPSSPGSPARGGTPITPSPPPEPRPRTPPGPPAPLVPEGLSTAPPDGPRAVEPLPGGGAAAEGVALQEVQGVQGPVLAAPPPGPPGGVRSADDPPSDRPDDRTADTPLLDAAPAPEDPAPTATAADALIATATQQVTAVATAAPATTGEPDAVPETTAEDGPEAEEEPRRSPETPRAAETTEEEPSEPAPPLEDQRLEAEAGAPSSGGLQGRDSTPSEPVEGGEASTPAEEEEEEEEEQKEEEEVEQVEQVEEEQEEQVEEEQEEQQQEEEGEEQQQEEEGEEVEQVEKEQVEEEEQEGEEQEEEEGEVSMSSADPQAEAPDSPPVETPGAPLPSGADGSAGQEADQTVVTTDACPLSAAAPRGPVGVSDCELGAMDSIREIRELVSEVVDVEELLQRYPDGVPREEEG
ncbi:unnamed protein product [Arctogadus glacialis]